MKSLKPLNGHKITEYTPGFCSCRTLNTTYDGEDMVTRFHNDECWEHGANGRVIYGDDAMPYRVPTREEREVLAGLFPMINPERFMILDGAVTGWAPDGKPYVQGPQGIPWVQWERDDPT